MKKRVFLYLLFSILFTACGGESGDIKDNHKIILDSDANKLNIAPIAKSQSIILTENSSKVILLSGTDPDGDLQIGVTRSYSRDGATQIVTDNVTGQCVSSIYKEDVAEDIVSCLMWQDTSFSNAITFTWDESIIYCQDLNFEGFDDWRLPNINELFSIVDYTRSNQEVQNYWSSTTHRKFQASAWHVLLENGKIYTKEKSYKSYVRCVRDK